IGADLFPRVAHVMRAEEKLITRINGLVVVLRDDDRRHPLRAQIRIGGANVLRRVASPSAACGSSGACRTGRTLPTSTRQVGRGCGRGRRWRQVGSCEVAVVAV